MDADALRAWFDARVATHDFSGAALVWRDGAPVFGYAGGVAHRGHGVPVTATTRFGVASLSKPVTAITVLRLVERGLVGLHQPLIEILPPEQLISAITPEHTLYHLLSHTSGLPDYIDDNDETDSSWIAAFDRVPLHRMRRPADLIPLMADLPAVAPPGTVTTYLNSGFVFVGLVIEAVTGRPFGDVSMEEVIRPAGMVDTSHETFEEEPARLATGYVTDDGPFEGWRSNMLTIPSVPMPDGGMITTTTDLARLFDALLGGRLVSAETLAEMTRPQGPPNGDDPERFGLCLQTVMVDGEVRIIGHGGGDPGVSAILAHHLREGITVVALCNQDRGAWAAKGRLEAELGLSDPRA
jgi:CubicO group peptidase (beta-lactamase class C family)